MKSALLASLVASAAAFAPAFVPVKSPYAVVSKTDSLAFKVWDNRQAFASYLIHMELLW